MAWWYLVAAGLFEVVWASSLKYTEGFTRFWPSGAPCPPWPSAYCCWRRPSDLFLSGPVMPYGPESERREPG